MTDKENSDKEKSGPRLSVDEVTSFDNVDILSQTVL